jgi:hypothetical protein
MLVDSKYLLWYLLGDMGIYLAQKIARGDFWYWVPIYGVVGLWSSLSSRIGAKLVADFTGIIQFRGSAELGGFYFSLSMFMAFVGSFAAVKVYYAEADPKDIVMQESSMWLLIGSLSVLWLLCFIIFILSIKKRYVHTFYNLETGNEWAENKLLKGETDFERADMFTINKKKWKRIEAEAKAWIQDNWERWEEEQPDWFTEVWKAGVDDDMIPEAEMRRQKVAGGGQRRRSSIGEMLGGSARDRRGSATIAPEVAAGVVGNEEEFHDAQNGGVVEESSHDRTTLVIK